ncbi:MAG: CHAD domain-containing protein [Candidatus Acidiferrales bacterium]
MASVSLISTAVPARRAGLEFWMQRVLELAVQVRGDWNAEAVHDLRVAIRRCRTMAEALAEVNPDPGWKKIKKVTRDLFRALGSLRDAQVAREWIKKLSDPGDSVRKHMLRIAAQQETTRRRESLRELDRFDRKGWKKWARKLPDRSQFFPAESVVFQRLALSRLHDSVELYQRARRGRSRVAWHRLRIGLKQFRYVVENFLPQRYEVWGGDLKRMQDLLGEVHDLDVLRADLVRHHAGMDAIAVEAWLKKIEAARKTRLEEFRLRVSDKESLWLVWRAGFGWGHTLRSAASEPRKIYSAS